MGNGIKLFTWFLILSYRIYDQRPHPCADRSGNSCCGRTVGTWPNYSNSRKFLKTDFLTYGKVLFMHFVKRIGTLLLLATLFSCVQAQVSSAPSSNQNAALPAVGGPAANAFIENPARWNLVSDQNGVRVYKDLEASPGRVGLRGKAIVDASIAKVATAFTDLDVRKKWMGALVENRIISQVSDFERIEYEKMKVSFPYSYCDFVYKMTFSVLRNPLTLMIRMASVDGSSVPVPPDTVRGQMTNSYDFVRQIDADHSEVVVEMGLDPKGALPSWDSQKEVLEWFKSTMQALKFTVEDPKFRVSKRVTDYIKKHNLDGND